jgi:two-component system response regulator PilR (NtrC family)
MSAPARNTQACALVVDDERDIRELLVLTLGRMGLQMRYRLVLHDARALLRHNAYALCLTDMRLADGSGLDLVREISQLYPQTPVAMITAFGNQEAAVGALKAGAFDFVSKPVDLSVLARPGPARAEAGPGIRSRRRRPARRRPRPGGTRLLGSSMAMAELRTTLPRSPAARRRSTSPANPAWARNWSRAPSTTRACAPPGPSCR